MNGMSDYTRTGDPAHLDRPDEEILSFATSKIPIMRFFFDML